MTALMTILGIVIFAFGLLVSIAWHELGHLTWAKVFKIRVPQYMVGFGPTIWSRKKGDTEYGVKAIPLGGYIRMIGMFPPGKDGKVTARSTSPWRSMIEDAREQSYEEILPGDETRLFYTRKPWQKVIVMFAGPFMNLVLAFGLFLALFMGFGMAKAVPTVSYVSACVLAQGSASTNTCPADARPSPAAAAGMKAGDKVVSFNGDPISSYDQLQNDIRNSAAGTAIPVVVERNGARITLSVTPVENTVYVDDSNGNPTTRTMKAGFVGLSPVTTTVPLGFGESMTQMYDMAKSGVHSVLALPSKIPALWDSAFDGAPRATDSPVGVVGVARVGGEAFAMKAPLIDRFAFEVQLLAGLNLSLFLLNMLPLLPLDGGHIAGALWESFRRRMAQLFRRPDPGHFDVAKLMPVAYVVAGVFLCFTVLVMIADVVNPVKIG
ncbi:M50 family metallopeptidase [Streptacidiphilus carbonis]|jgi:membrane-associated protease RseP (regulator of RpoE activity)|uniref:M50 family metallopeptidase n=1 Tax=Streptacidiphilus carbonis TaxID=105422 RepID=UPI0005A8C66D|nr:site-2 protease family protein [Streptacidiphilus carbonis]